MRILLRTAIFLSLAGSLRASDSACPETLAVTESLRENHESWTEGRSRIPMRLSGITIFEGDPGDRASLIGEDHKLSRTTSTSTWRFVPGAKYFIACSYSGTRITLSRPIPPRYRMCTITYATDVFIDGAPEIKKMEWR